jgi:hypothetical protein
MKSRKELPRVNTKRCTDSVARPAILVSAIIYYHHHGLPFNTKRLRRFRRRPSLCSRCEKARPSGSHLLNGATRLTNGLGANPTPTKLSQINYNYSANTYICGAIYSIYNSPIVAAIKACWPQNIATLLAAGADPNRIRLEGLDEYSVRFIRGRNPEYNTYSFSQCPLRAKVMPAVGDQTAPLTCQRNCRSSESFFYVLVRA